MLRTRGVLLSGVAGTLAVLLVVGCAGTPPKPTFSQSISAGQRIAAPDGAQVVVDAPDTLAMLGAEKDRLAEKITLKINTRKVSNSSPEAAKTYQVAVHITRYEKGNKFARFMLVGLGQIHIDGTVEMFQMPAHAPVGKFDMKKTFAWGGIYGGVTGIEEIEDTYADGVAAAVTGQEEKSETAKK